MRCSIAIATHNKANLLYNTLKSIYRQKPPFNFEVIITDDGSVDDTKEICELYPVQYYHLENNTYRNPSKARNNSYKHAKGDIIICQSDEVVHINDNTIEKLCELQPGTFIISEIWNGNIYDINSNGITWEKIGQWNPYISHKLHPKHRHPIFFLGSVFRSDLYAIGGNDEEFTTPAYEDNWFSDCLINGRGLQPIFAIDIIGVHQHHDRIKNLKNIEQQSKLLYESKITRAKKGEIKWEATGGSWPL